MKDTELHKLRYPVGEYSPKKDITSGDVTANIQTIETFPEKLKLAVKGLNDTQLDTQYRGGGWTIRQVVHHVVDSHINSYTRFKLTLTEDTPAIRPYFEDRWAELPDAKSAPVELSLQLLEALHNRWVVMLKNIAKDELKRKFFHPESRQEMALDELMGLYAWHCRHHLAHITELKKRMNW
jgi:hypothetical protein